MVRRKLNNVIRSGFVCAARHTNGISKTMVALLVAAAAVTSALPAHADINQFVKLLASDGAANDSFGGSVAIDGTTAVVGAYLNDDNGTNSGSAYLFDTTTNLEIAKLLPDDGTSGDLFGVSVAIDGATVVVGAPFDDENGFRSGSAYLFDISDPANPVQIAKLLPNAGAVEDFFGISVAISGSTAIVGVERDDDNANNSGSAYLFDSSTGQQLFKLLPNDGETDERFGLAVAISGTIAIVGAFGDDDNGFASGSAYLFDTTTGQQLFKLLPNDGAEGDRFATTVDINGTTAIVGASQNQDHGHNSGSAYLFDVTTGQQLFKLLPDDGAAYDRFGRSVAISGSFAIVGASRDINFTGSAYLFDTITGQQVAKLFPVGALQTQQFGSSIAIDGTTSIIGTPFDDENGSFSGAAYVVELADIDGDGVDDDVDACPDSDVGSTILIDGEETGVENDLLDNGCSLADLITEVLANDPSTTDVVQFLVDLKGDGYLSGQELGAMLQAINSP